MNLQQAAAIYVRSILEQSVDELVQMAHTDFTITHGQGIAEADPDAIYQAVRTVQAEIGLRVTDIDMRQAVETLRADAWARVDAPEQDAS